MSLRQRIDDDIRTALKGGDRLRVSVLRMVKSAFQEREVALRSKHGRDYTLDDDEALGVLARAAKQRRESVESFRQGGRGDLAEKEEAELALVENYLPKALEESELREIVQAAIQESGATSPRDMGAVMRLVMPKVQGRADGKAVNRLVREMLSG